jgi:hypothetical protein
MSETNLHSSTNSQYHWTLAETLSAEVRQSSPNAMLKVGIKVGMIGHD